MRIAMVAGEASGDLLGAALIRAFKQKNPDITFVGLGGSHMIAEGFNSLFDIERLSVMGFIEPLKRLPDLFKLRRQLYQHFIANPPDVFIGIDAPDFNIGLELKLKKAGIKTVHYVSPSVWAWRQYRLKKIAKAVDLMLTLFPFEESYYQANHVPVTCVGHPLADMIPLEPDTKAAKRALGLEENISYIALLPGSRKQEIQLNGEVFLLAAKELAAKYPTLQFITSHINEDRASLFRNMQTHLAPALPIHFYTARTQEVLAASDYVIVTSGTATLEAMLYKKPMVIGYKMTWFTNLLAKWLVKTPFAGLPNIIAGKEMVPELIQEKLTPNHIAEKIEKFMMSPQLVTEIKNECITLHKSLKMQSAERVADAVMDLIK